jgi:hypothetical protein
MTGSDKIGSAFKRMMYGSGVFKGNEENIRRISGTKTKNANGNHAVLLD